MQTRTVATAEVEAASAGSSCEVSIVMPCLNEADTLATCIDRARRCLDDSHIDGEIVVADNGSTDGSQQIARRMGARVVAVTERGYGSALMGGIAAARGRFIVMGDADDSYDFSETAKFVDKLRAGADLVQGCRLPAGGGHVRPGAMPALHRWLGNPLFTLLVRWWFWAPIHDVYCGLRAFRKELFESLGQRCTGMEFATEMIIRATLSRARIAEVPITLHRDGRRSHPPHLKTFRDGWRTLRFFLLYSPRWLFLRPGIALLAAGALGYAIALPGLTIASIHFDVHTLVVASLALIVGHEAVVFAVFAKAVAVREGLLPPDARLPRLFATVTLERLLVTGLVAIVAGLALIAWAANLWRDEGFGNLDYATTMRWVVPGATLTALGFQTMLSGFFATILRRGAA